MESQNIRTGWEGQMFNKSWDPVGIKSRAVLAILLPASNCCADNVPICPRIVHLVHLVLGVASSA